eukprot:s4751_g6.t1
MADSETWSVPEEGPLPTRLGKLQSDPVPQHWLSEVSVRQLVTEVDEDLLRGVTLSECLTGCGKHWAMQPASAMLETQQKDYGRSFQVRKYHHFLSHDWKTSGSKKLLAMLLLFNSRAAMLATLTCGLTIGLLREGTHIDSDQTEGELYLSSNFTYVAFVVFFYFWQPMRSMARRPLVVFLDKLCIAQHDAGLKQQGILGLAAFLDRSEHLTILWSARYFRRLWCCYELATYLRNPDQANKPLTIFPVDLSLVLISYAVLQGGFVILTNLMVSHLQPLIDQAPAVLALQLSLWCLLCVAGLPNMIYVVLQVYKDLEDLPAFLSEFSIQHSQCFCCSSNHLHPETGAALECDRELVFDTVKAWYSRESTENHPVPEEHLDRFNSAVRTTLRTRAFDGVEQAMLPLRTITYITVGMTAPWMCNQVTWMRDLCLRGPEGIGPALIFWRCFVQVLRIAARISLVLVLGLVMLRIYRWVIPWLKRRSLVKVSLVASVVCFVVWTFIYMAWLLPYQAARRSGVDFSPGLSTMWLLAVGFQFRQNLRRCRCC